MRKIYLLFFIILFSCGEVKKETQLLCDNLGYVLSANGDTLTKNSSVVTILNAKIKNEAEVFSSIFENDRVYIFSLIEYPYARFYLLDRSTLKLYFKLYYLDGRYLFGRNSPKPPTDIKTLSDEIFDQNVVKQCSIKEKKI